MGCFRAESSSSASVSGSAGPKASTNHGFLALLGCFHTSQKNRYEHKDGTNTEPGEEACPQEDAAGQRVSPNPQATTSRRAGETASEHTQSNEKSMKPASQESEAGTHTAAEKGAAGLADDDEAHHVGENWLSEGWTSVRSQLKHVKSAIRRLGSGDEATNRSFEAMVLRNKSKSRVQWDATVVEPSDSQSRDIKRICTPHPQHEEEVPEGCKPSVSFGRDTDSPHTTDFAILCRQKTPFPPGHQHMHPDFSPETAATATTNPAILARQKTPFPPGHQPLRPDFTPETSCTTTTNPAILARQKTPFPAGHEPLRPDFTPETDNPETRDAAILLRQKTPYPNGHIALKPQFEQDAGSPRTNDPAILQRQKTPWAPHHVPMHPSFAPGTDNPSTRDVRILMRAKTPRYPRISDPSNPESSCDETSARYSPVAAAAAEFASRPRRHSETGSILMERTPSRNALLPPLDHRVFTGDAPETATTDPAILQRQKTPWPAGHQPMQAGFDEGTDSPHTTSPAILERQKTPWPAGHQSMQAGFTEGTDSPTTTSPAILARQKTPWPDGHTPMRPEFEQGTHSPTTSSPAILARQKTPWPAGHEVMHPQFDQGTPSPTTTDPGILMRQETPYPHDVPQHPDFAAGTEDPATLNPAILARTKTPFAFNVSPAPGGAHFDSADDPTTTKPQILLRQKTPYMRAVPTAEDSDGGEEGQVRYPGASDEGNSSGPAVETYRADSGSGAAGPSSSSTPPSPGIASMQVYSNPLSPDSAADAQADGFGGFSPDAQAPRVSPNLLGGRATPTQQHRLANVTKAGAAATPVDRVMNHFDGACDSPHTTNEQILDRQKTPFVRRGGVFGDDDLDEDVAKVLGQHYSPTAAPHAAAVVAAAAGSEAVAAAVAGAGDLDEKYRSLKLRVPDAICDTGSGSLEQLASLPSAGAPAEQRAAAGAAMPGASPGESAARVVAAMRLNPYNARDPITGARRTPSSRRHSSGGVSSFRSYASSSYRSRDSTGTMSCSSSRRFSLDSNMWGSLHETLTRNQCEAAAMLRAMLLEAAAEDAVGAASQGHGGLCSPPGAQLTQVVEEDLDPQLYREYSIASSSYNVAGLRAHSRTASVAQWQWLDHHLRTQSQTSVVARDAAMSLRRSRHIMDDEDPNVGNGGARIPDPNHMVVDGRNGQRRALLGGSEPGNWQLTGSRVRFAEPDLTDPGGPIHGYDGNRPNAHVPARSAFSVSAAAANHVCHASRLGDAHRSYSRTAAHDAPVSGRVPPPPPDVPSTQSSFAGSGKIHTPTSTDPGTCSPDSTNNSVPVPSDPAAAAARSGLGVRAAPVNYQQVDLADDGWGEIMKAAQRAREQGRSEGQAQAMAALTGDRDSAGCQGLRPAAAAPAPAVTLGDGRPVLLPGAKRGKAVVAVGEEEVLMRGADVRVEQEKDGAFKAGAHEMVVTAATAPEPPRQALGVHPSPTTQQQQLQHPKMAVVAAPPSDAAAALIQPGAGKVMRLSAPLSGPADATAKPASHPHHPSTNQVAPSASPAAASVTVRRSSDSSPAAHAAVVQAGAAHVAGSSSSSSCFLEGGKQAKLMAPGDHPLPNHPLSHYLPHQQQQAHLAPVVDTEVGGPAADLAGGSEQALRINSGVMRELHQNRAGEQKEPPATQQADAQLIHVSSLHSKAGSGPAAGTAAASSSQHSMTSVQSVPGQASTNMYVSQRSRTDQQGRACRGSGHEGVPAAWSGADDAVAAVPVPVPVPIAETAYARQPSAATRPIPGPGTKRGASFAQRSQPDSKTRIVTAPAIHNHGAGGAVTSPRAAVTAAARQHQLLQERAPESPAAHANEMRSMSLGQKLEAAGWESPGGRQRVHAIGSRRQQQGLHLGVPADDV